MSYRTTNPAGAKALLDSEDGWTYVDVRTEEEFHAKHVAGAYNVPVFVRDAAGGMAPNPEFAAVMTKNFLPGSKLVLGCAAGVRSMRACEQLEGAGYADLVNMHGGFSGAREQTGEITEAGWEACGYPCDTTPAPERTYSSLQKVS